ncbi:MAG TPA: hypothetical protein PLJ25_01330 [Methanothrix sp.]|nr:hypothetical protein [Methanothrix sp.]
MTTKNNLAIKAAAILMMLIGLAAMLVAWDLLLVAEFYTKTVLVLEMGGVAVCLVGYFMYKRARRSQGE